MMRKLLRVAAIAGAVTLGACDLAIENPISGDTDRVLGSPADAEALISTYFKRWHSGVYGSTTNMEGMASVMSLMNYSSLANNCLNNHLPFANISNGNTPGNVCAGEQVRLYQYMNEVARVASNLLEQMDKPVNPLNLGNTDPATDAKNVKARAWAEFLRGISLGYVALMHDSSAVISQGMSKSEPDCADAGGVCSGALRHYPVVADSAMAALERALVYTNTPAANLTGSGGFPIDNTWLPSPTNWTTDEFSRLIRSYRARIRANMPRTSAEVVDWAAVVADAQNGFTADHYVITSSTTGPNNAWRTQFDDRTTWHQMPAFIIGMADQSGAYEAWLATPLGDRGAGNTGFFMVTSDLRFPQGATRAAQQADVSLASCEPSATACKRYFMNRSAANDQFSGPGYGWSNYDHVRFRSWRVNGDAASGTNGRTLSYTKAELDMLQAEGLYKIGGNDAAVAALINGAAGNNGSRTRGMGTHPVFATTNVALGGGLPAVLALRTSAATGAMPACIPKVPRTSGAVVCGDLWEALKYEKRIETAYTHYAPWFLDSRRWDDLPKDTPLYWAVPYQDLQARGRTVAQLYGTGPGQAPGSTAPGSAYGW